MIEDPAKNAPVHLGQLSRRLNQQFGSFEFLKADQNKLAWYLGQTGHFGTAESEGCFLASLLTLTDPNFHVLHETIQQKLLGLGKFSQAYSTNRYNDVFLKQGCYSHLDDKLILQMLDEFIREKGFRKFSSVILHLDRAKQPPMRILEHIDTKYYADISDFVERLEPEKLYELYKDYASQDPDSFTSNTTLTYGLDLFLRSRQNVKILFMCTFDDSEQAVVIYQRLNTNDKNNYGLPASRDVSDVLTFIENPGELENGLIEFLKAKPQYGYNACLLAAERGKLGNVLFKCRNRQFIDILSKNYEDKKLKDSIRPNLCVLLEDMEQDCLHFYGENNLQDFSNFIKDSMECYQRDEKKLVSNIEVAFDFLSFPDVSPTSSFPRIIRVLLETARNKNVILNVLKRVMPYGMYLMMLCGLGPAAAWDSSLLKFLKEEAAKIDRLAKIQKTKIGEVLAISDVFLNLYVEQQNLKVPTTIEDCLNFVCDNSNIEDSLFFLSPSDYITLLKMKLVPEETEKSKLLLVPLSTSHAQDARYKNAVQDRINEFSPQQQQVITKVLQKL